MLRLSLLRHAKSGTDNPGLTDHERQLTRRGTSAARAVGRYIVENDLIPDVILCSDAVRTRATLSLILDACPAPKPGVSITGDLYLATPAVILRTIAQASGSTNHIMVIGHNPGMHALALSLSADAESNSDLERLATKYPTAALALLTFEISDWSNIDTATGHLERFITPRDLPE
jgi:phosphohistidine phosphatase